MHSLLYHLYDYKSLFFLQNYRYLDLLSVLCVCNGVSIPDNQRYITEVWLTKEKSVSVKYLAPVLAIASKKCIHNHTKIQEIMRPDLCLSDWATDGCLMHQGCPTVVLSHQCATEATEYVTKKHLQSLFNGKNDQMSLLIHFTCIFKYRIIRKQLNSIY